MEPRTERFTSVRSPGVIYTSPLKLIPLRIASFSLFLRSVMQLVPLTVALLSNVERYPCHENPQEEIYFVDSYRLLMRVLAAVQKSANLRCYL